MRPGVRPGPPHAAECLPGRRHQGLERGQLHAHRRDQGPREPHQRHLHQRQAHLHRLQVGAPPSLCGPWRGGGEGGLQGRALGGADSWRRWAPPQAPPPLLTPAQVSSITAQPSHPQSQLWPLSRGRPAAPSGGEPLTEVSSLSFSLLPFPHSSLPCRPTPPAPLPPCPPQRLQGEAVDLRPRTHPLPSSPGPGHKGPRHHPALTPPPLALSPPSLSTST